MKAELKPRFALANTSAKLFAPPMYLGVNVSYFGLFY